MSQLVRRGPLPTGVQNFRKVRSESLYYVDKSPFALQLFSQGEHFFLSRPRRFGKSLFLSMLQELFSGSRDLFKGLSAYRHWDWSVHRPVLLLDLSNVNARSEGSLDADICDQLLDLEADAGIERRHATAPGRLRHLIRTLHRCSGRRAVLLVDEYDKPITDALDSPCIARLNRDYLSSLYSVVKSCDASLRFTLLTGVSKFSKVSLFSSLNNLNDITLDPRYSSICGYTDKDIDTVFAPELPGLDRDEIRKWYNGYSWGGDERVYNPYDVLLLFDKREFRAWWFETGTPRFSLAETLVRRHVLAPNLDGMHATDELLSAFDVESISTQALLFQTGNLTVLHSEVKGGQRHYRLGYPNREVRASLNRQLLAVLTPPPTEDDSSLAYSLPDQIRSARFPEMAKSLWAFFSGIPHDWHRNNDIDRFEGYYASVFFALLNGSGLDARPEEASSSGNLDLAIVARNRIVLIEFKTVPGQTGSGRALQQLKAKRYAEKHLASGKPVHLVGVEFSIKTRNVALVQWETAGLEEAGQAHSQEFIAGNATSPGSGTQLRLGQT